MNLKEMLNRPGFNIMFSLLLGIGMVTIIRPLCKGAECLINRSPPVKDWDGKVFRIGSECYEFNTVTVKCPGKDEIESFRDNFNRRTSIIR